MKIAYLGPEGTFSHSAAKLYLDGVQEQNGELICAPSIYDAFSYVDQEIVDIAVLPIENSIEGSVNVTLDCLAINNDVNIVHEIMLGIRQNLLAKSLDITKIYSHAHAIGQCGQFIHSQCPDIPVLVVSSTSRAAEIAMNEDGAAAIGGSILAEMYGLKIISEGIEDFKNNSTRFAIVQKKGKFVSNADKTSIVFGVEHKPGSLCKILELFNDAGINMLRIESRPSKRFIGEYVFFIDIGGGIQESHIVRTMEQVRRQSIYYKLLGSYKDFGSP